MTETWDAVIVGAGPAGLTAATYLARFRRRVLVLDGGQPRAAWIPESHNTPGFPAGIGGPELLARLRAQALEFGAEIRPGLAEGLEPMDRAFRIRTGEAPYQAAAVLLATGVADHLPDLPGLDAAIRDSRVRLCPICDAYEAIDGRLAVLGSGAFAGREAEFLRTYSADVTILAPDDDPQTPQGALRIEFPELALAPDGVVLRQLGQPERRFDYLYLALGCTARSDLAARAGARRDETGNLIVDAHQMTSVAGLYAAGDVVRGLNQIAVGAGEAAIAATAMHNRLRGI